MPFVLKPPIDGSKGILIFTHKERPLLESRRRLLIAARERMRERYVVGMHWGHFYANVGEMPYVDFHLAGPGTVYFRPGVHARRIPLCSRNFTRECFRDLGLPKYWDILTVSRPIRLKNLDQFLLVVRKIYDRGYSPRVLLVCVHPSLMTERDGWHTTLKREYEQLLSAEERERVTLLMIEADGDAFPLASPFLSYLYNSSRSFALFSDQEGESRVIAEALLCGVPVFVKRSLRGGGRDYLDERNSCQFGTVDEACAMFIEMISGRRQWRFDAGRYEAELGERSSARKLVASIQQLFADLGLEFGGDLDLVDLGRKLPGHHLSLPESLRMPASNDLRSVEAAIRYMNALSGSSLTRAKEGALRLETATAAVGERTRHLLHACIGWARRGVRWLEMAGVAVASRSAGRSR